MKIFLTGKFPTKKINQIYKFLIKYVVKET